MDDDPTRRSSKPAASAAALLLALPLLYVLSAGPVAYVTTKSSWIQRRPRLTNAVMIVYTPLQPLATHESLGPPFLRYVSWWLDQAHEPYTATGPDPFAPAVQDLNNPIAQPSSDPFAQDSKGRSVQEPK